MSPNYHLRTDLERVKIGGFALPLGMAPPAGKIQPPIQGYTVSFLAGEEDEPDTYSFHVVVSHERVAPILHRCFDLLPQEVFGIIEIGSRDAYRSIDTFISQEPIDREAFLDAWQRYEPLLLEDSSLAAGANSEEPFIEIFLDHWKSLAIHVPPSMREEVEALLHEFGLEEVAQTWPDSHEPEIPADETEGESQIRPVLDLSDENAPDIDEILLDIRHEWKLELNIDPDSNIDEGGRDLGSTLWHAVVIVDHRPKDHASGNGSTAQGGIASVWATAVSLNEMERLIHKALERYPEWSFGEIYTIDRVAFDERPDELADLRPGRRESQIHLVTVEAWAESERKQ